LRSNASLPTGKRERDGLSVVRAYKLVAQDPLNMGGAVDFIKPRPMAKVGTCRRKFRGFGKPLEGRQVPKQQRKRQNTVPANIAASGAKGPEFRFPIESENAPPSSE